MRKILPILLALVLVCSGLCMVAGAAAPSAKLTGPGTVRADDTITLTFRLNGTNIYGLESTLLYDSQQVTLIGTKSLLKGDWMLETGKDANYLLAYDNAMTAPINGETQIFSATFKVKNLSEGESVRIGVTKIIATDGSNEYIAEDAYYEIAIAPPLSTDCTLASLTVTNADVSPAFGASTTIYNASVPFEVEKLALNAVAADSGAKVSIHNPVLTPDGTTDVTVTVTAEDGTTKVYTIRVHRAKDPNYIPSANSYLCAIHVEEFRLSPLFSSDRFDYLIWLPYEVDSVYITADAQDSKASVQIQGGQHLIAGADNEISIICTAENGSQRTYTVIAKRAPSHDAPPATQPVIPTEPTQPTQPKPTDSTAPSTTQPIQQTQPIVPDRTEPVQESMSPVLIVLLCVIGVSLIAIVVIILLIVRSSKRQGRFSK